MLFRLPSLLLTLALSVTGIALAQPALPSTGTAATSAATTAVAASTAQPAGNAIASSATAVYADFAGKKFQRGPSGSKKIALTFDDGPHPRTTARLLEILKREQVAATFFMLGNMVEQNPGLAKQVADGGFEIGNHSWNHPDLRKAGLNEIRDQLDRTSAIITQATGQQVHLMRPPYGNIGDGLKKITAESGLVMVNWSIDPRDWAVGTKPDAVTQRVLKGAHPGAIVCMHDTKEQTIQAMPEIIKGLRAAGYEFVTVGQLLADAKAHPELMAGAATSDDNGEATGYGAPEAAAQPLAIPLTLTTRN